MFVCLLSLSSVGQAQTVFKDGKLSSSAVKSEGSNQSVEDIILSSRQMLEGFDTFKKVRIKIGTEKSHFTHVAYNSSSSLFYRIKKGVLIVGTQICEFIIKTRKGGGDKLFRVTHSGIFEVKCPTGYTFSVEMPLNRQPGVGFDAQGRQVIVAFWAGVESNAIEMSDYLSKRLQNENKLQISSTNSPSSDGT